MNIDAKPCQISELMPVEGKIKFNIPDYQRNYSWSEENIETLINDIQTESEGYYLGNIIFTTNKDDKNTVDIVDGQQRFTTISLIFLSLYDILNTSRKNELLSEDKEKEYFIKVLDIQRRLISEEDKSIKLTLLEPDKTIYSDLIEGIVNSKETRLHKNKIFGKRYQSTKKSLLNRFFDADEVPLNTPIEDKVEKVLKFYSKLIYANVLKISVMDLNDAFTIFTSFNAKGVPLTLIDLFKSYYIREAGDSPEALNNWYQLLNIFNNKNEEPISNVVTQFLLNNYDTFENTSKSSITRGSALSEYDTLFAKNKAGYIETLIYRARLFSYLNPNIVSTDNFNLDKETLSNLSKLSKLDSTQVIPVVLFLLDRLLKGKTTSEIFNDFMEFLISYYVRRNFILKPKSSNIRAKSLQCLRDFESNELIDAEIIQEFKEIFKSIAASDEDFERALSDSVYTTSKQTTRFILVELERENGKLFNKQNPDTLESLTPSGSFIWTLEHILPQSAEVNKTWKKELLDSGVSEEELSQKLEEYTHKLGNLTLTGYNSEMSAKSFKDKRDFKDKNTLSEAGLKTKLWLNQSISAPGEDINNKENWTFDDIDRRTAELVKEAVEIYTLD